MNDHPTTPHLIREYLIYIRSVRRYSSRTVAIYEDSLKTFYGFAMQGCGCSTSSDSDSRSDTRSDEGKNKSEGKDRDEGKDKGTGEGKDIDEGKDEDKELIESLTPSLIRSYEVFLLDSEGLSARTVNLHISVLSGFCRYLLKRKILGSNPVKTVTRPKTEKRLPEFYKKESMEEYFANTEPFAGEETIYVSPNPKQTKWMYERRLGRAVISTLYCTGIRRSELMKLRIGDVDFGRNVARITGKGDKMREIPLVPSLCKEISLYLRAVETMVCADRTSASPLFVSYSGKMLYPEYVDRMVKNELGAIGSITGKKSPHVLRHTLATELLDEGADLNSIKELLGHSSLAATQVYTHNSIARLKKVYETAHPRANKNGGKNGD